MKNKKWIAVFIIAIMVSLVLTGCGSKYPLNGIWVCEEDGDEIFIAFIDDMYFLGEIYRGKYDLEAFGTYNFEKDSGSFRMDGERVNLSLKGNTLTLSVGRDFEIDFKKEPSTKTAPAAIAGVWKGPRPWVFAFINDVVFIVDEDGDPDYGFYKFSGNKGDFETEQYGWDVEFTVKGNTLSPTGDVRRDFTRER